MLNRLRLFMGDVGYSWVNRVEFRIVFQGKQREVHVGVRKKNEQCKSKKWQLPVSNDKTKETRY